ncbi:hypothetical protein ABHB27_17850, partial [Flavonifractor plautii]
MSREKGGLSKPFSDRPPFLDGRTPFRLFVQGIFAGKLGHLGPQLVLLALKIGGGTPHDGSDDLH